MLHQSSLINIQLLGMDCSLLNVEDNDVLVNIIFIEQNDFEDHASYDHQLPGPNWVDFLIRSHVKGHFICLSAHLQIKSGSSEVLFVPYKPLHPFKGTSDGTTRDNTVRSGWNKRVNVTQHS